MIVLRDGIGAEAVEAPLVHTSDLDDLVERVNDLMSSHTVTPARPGGFTAHVEGMQTPGLSLLDMDYGMPLRLRAEPLPGYVAVCLPLTGSMDVHHKGVSFEAAAGVAGLLGTPDDELVMDWDAQLRLQVLRVEFDAVRRLGARMITDDDAGLDELHFDPVMETGGLTRAVLGQARLMQDLIGAAGSDSVNPLAAAQLREQLMGTLLLGQPNSWTEVLCRRGRDHSARTTIQGAAELLSARAGEPVGIAEIARAVGLSVRALHAGFRREFEVSPKQYLQRVRLERAHDDLLAGGPGVRVIDVAHRWGFTNPGRFATTYRHRYGQAPSVTRGHAP